MPINLNKKQNETITPMGGSISFYLDQDSQNLSTDFYDIAFYEEEELEDIRAQDVAYIPVANDDLTSDNVQDIIVELNNRIKDLNNTIQEDLEDLNLNINNLSDIANEAHESTLQIASEMSALDSSVENELNEINSALNNYVPYTGGTMQGKLVAQENTDYTVKQMRNIIIATTDPVASAMSNGDIWIKIPAE